MRAMIDDIWVSKLIQMVALGDLSDSSFNFTRRAFLMLKIEPVDD